MSGIFSRLKNWLQPAAPANGPAGAPKTLEELRADVEIKALEKGHDDAETLRSRGSLADALENSGRADEAEAVQRAILSALERTSGPEHPYTLECRNRIANAMSSQ